MDWKPVRSFWGGYTVGFDPDAQYEFKRQDAPDDAATVFRLSDASPYFNLADLYFRPKSATPPASQKPVRSIPDQR